MKNNHFGQFEEFLTASWNRATDDTDNEIAFTLVLKATENSSLSEALQISSERTQAIAYDQYGKAMNIGLSFTSDEFELAQNQPNPFSETTIIEYAIPEKANESKIIFTDLNGSVIKTVAVNGIGQLEITTPNFPAGTYTYSLVLDGKVVATNKMVLTK